MARNIPLHHSISQPLEQDGTNLSLFFDRAFGGYSSDFAKRSSDGKPNFFKAIRSRFERRAGSASATEYLERVRRRKRALEACGGWSAEMESTQPLVLGLGLPHPTEAGFLLDRLTSVPFIPGTSVKGLLRHAARLTGQEELPVQEAHPEAASYWRTHLDRIFGPMIDGAMPPQRGALRVYDAYPSVWPSLEVDVLTPHHGPYYSSASQDDPVPPGDWHEPIPVPFLTVAEGTVYQFGFVPAATGAVTQQDVLAIHTLLTYALDWLGVGAKARSQGYGTFREVMNEPSQD